MVDVDYVALIAAPGVIGTDQFIDGVPALFIVLRWLGGVGGIGDNLPPEEAVEVVPDWAGNHSVGDVEIGKTIVIEIPGIAGPRPTAHGSGRGLGNILKHSAAAVSK